MPPAPRAAVTARPAYGDRHRRRRLIGVGLVALATLVAVRLTTGGFAPAELVAAEPGDGARLGAPPAEVSLTFSAEVDPTNVHVVVAGPDGSTVSVGEPVVSGATVVQPVRIGGQGAVRVAYHAELDGGRQIDDQLEFLVGEPAPGEPADLPAAADEGLHAHGPLGLLGIAMVLMILLGGAVVLVIAFRRPG